MKIAKHSRLGFCSTERHEVKLVPHQNGMHAFAAFDLNNDCTLKLLSSCTPFSDETFR